MLFACQCFYLADWQSRRERESVFFSHALPRGRQPAESRCDSRNCHVAVPRSAAAFPWLPAAQLMLLLPLLPMVAMVHAHAKHTCHVAPMLAKVACSC